MRKMVLAAIAAMAIGMGLCTGCGHSTPPAPSTYTVVSTGTGTATGPVVGGGGGTDTNVDTGGGTASQPNAAIVSLISKGSEWATDFALKQWAATHAQAATTTATVLNVAITDAIQPYLASGNLGDSAQVLDYVQGHLFPNVPDEIANVIKGSLALVLSHIPAPQPGQYMSGAAIGYLQAFLGGVSKGCTDYLAEPAAPVKSPTYREILKRDVERRAAAKKE